MDIRNLPGLKGRKKKNNKKKENTVREGGKGDKKKNCRKRNFTQEMGGVSKLHWGGGQEGGKGKLAKSEIHLAPSKGKK